MRNPLDFVTLVSLACASLIHVQFAVATEASSGEMAFLRLVSSHLELVRRNPIDPNDLATCVDKVDYGWLGRERVDVSAWHSDIGSLTVLTPEEVNYVFEKIANRRDLAFEWTNTGCSQRAYMIGKMLEMNGIKSARIWAQAPDKEHSLEIAHRLNPRKKVQWRFHTAIVVLVQTERGVEERILDPSVFDKPVSKDTWLQTITPERSTGQIKVAHSPWTDLYGPLEDGRAMAKMLVKNAGASFNDFLFNLSTAHLSRKETLVQRVKSGERVSSDGDCDEDCFQEVLKRSRPQE